MGWPKFFKCVFVLVIVLLAIYREMPKNSDAQPKAFRVRELSRHKVCYTNLNSDSFKINTVTNISEIYAKPTPIHPKRIFPEETRTCNAGQG